jgi:zinc D-Ala-D-Ala carboxypeptidase
MPAGAGVGRYQLSQNFYRDEFRSKDAGGHIQVPNALMGNLQELVRHVLQPLREQWGGVLYVVSGYRTLAHNAEIGGAIHSAHLDARAADIRPTNPSEVRLLHALALDLYLAGDLAKMGGLGIYDRWIHLDTRKAADGHLRRWSGAQHGAEPG